MYLGLDLGTSGLRGLLVSEDGTVVGDATKSYDVQSPKSGWAEQDPAVWVGACLSVLSKLAASFPAEYRALKGIGVAGHMHGATVLDHSGKVIRPCILWNDTRAAKEAAELDETPGFRELSGNIVFPGFTAPKLLWMARNEPENYALVSKVLLPKDYLVFWLTGEISSEMSDASGTSWLNVETRTWSEILINGSGMRRDQLPDVVEGCDVVGQLSVERAQQIGLSTDVSVVAGAADNAAAACGVGAFEEGQGFVSLGTSGVILAAKDRYAPDPSTAVHTFCHAMPMKWYQMGVILSATDSLNWMADNLGHSPEELADLLPDKPGGPGVVRFLPYLSGERTPHNDANARGAFLGLSRGSDQAALVQAVMEGVSFALRDCLEALHSTGTNLGSVLVIGGGSKSAFWVQTLANTLGIALHLPAKGDFGAAMGAARLAMIGAGGLSPQEVMAPAVIEVEIKPDRVLTDAYDASYRAYKQTYEAIKDLP